MTSCKINTKLKVPDELQQSYRLRIMRLSRYHVRDSIKFVFVFIFRYKFLVYSAFYERRIGRVIRLIGATKTRGPERVWCRFWYSANHSTTVPAKVKVSTYLLTVLFINSFSYTFTNLM